MTLQTCHLREPRTASGEAVLPGAEQPREQLGRRRDDRGERRIAPLGHHGVMVMARAFVLFVSVSSATASVASHSAMMK